VGNLQLTPELEEFFGRIARDPVLFADTLLPTKTRVKVDGVWTEHKGQRRWLREAFAPINVLVPGNRFGKSTVTAIRHLWFAMTKFVPKGRVLIETAEKPYSTISLAYSAEQAKIVFEMIRFIASSELFEPFVKDIKESPYPTIRLFNDSVINVRSAHDGGKYVDGFEYRYMSLDEAGYIDDLKSLVNGVMIMRLAGGGILDMLGTPKGITSNGLYWYASRALASAPRYYGMRGSIYDNPFLPEDDIRMRDRLIGSSDPKKRRQVIYGDFVDYSGLAFSHDARENMFRPEMPVHEDYLEDHTYVQAWDLGRQTDFTVGFTLDITTEPWRSVDFQRLNKVPWESIYDLIKAKAVEYHVDFPRIDATGPQGDVIEEELYKRERPVEPYRMSSLAKKLDLINTMQTVMDWDRKQVGEYELVDENGFRQIEPIMEEPDPGVDQWGLVRVPPIPVVIDEFGVYRHDDKKLTQDCVIALAMACHRAFEERAVGEPIRGGLYG
jgi:hypothetical protein